VVAGFVPLFNPELCHNDRPPPFLVAAGSRAMFYTLNLVWPSRLWHNRWIAALLFVFPGFLQQPVAVAFAQHFMTYLFFASSLFLTVLAIKQTKFFWLCMPLSFLLGGLHIFMMEYFVGLEILRPILIYFALCGDTKKKGFFWKTILYWSPFLLVLLGYLYWRLAYLPPTLSLDPNSPTLLKTMLDSPLNGLSNLVTWIYQDAVQLMISVWPNTLFNIETMDLLAKRAWISWFCGIAACLGFFFFNHYSSKYDPGTDRSNVQQIWMGVVIFLFGSGPVWATERKIASGMWSERFALAPMLGAVIIIVYSIEWLFRTRKQKQIMLTILLGISVSGQMVNQVIFRNDWNKQRDIYWQLHWRIPSLETGTALFGKGTFTEKSSYYDNIYIVNFLFNSSPDQEARYGYFDIFHTNLENYIPGIPLSQSTRGIQFIGNTSQAVVIDFGVRGGCVRILDSVYQGDPDISQSVVNLFDISDVSNIKLTPEHIPPVDLFGVEPQHNWCYYFEKADLARQMQDWNAIIQLKAEADRQGFAPDLAGEYLPFIEAFTHTGQWEEAYQLSELANEINLEAVATGDITTDVNAFLCNTWLGFANLDSGGDKTIFLEKASQEFCTARNR
jgi:hypothetical protein